MAEIKPKKKLSTGPINIVTPSNSTKLKQETSIPGNGKQDSDFQEFIIANSNLVDSIGDSDLQNSENLVYGKPETGIQETIKLKTGIQETIKQQTTLPERRYQKVAMRLSEESVEQLRRLKSSSGIPYEVIVDSIIGKWQSLPEDLQNCILDFAAEERFSRLMSGQEKAIATTRERMNQAKSQR